MRRMKRPKRIIKTACCLHTKKGKIPFLLSRSTGRRTLAVSIDERADVRVASPFTMREQEINAFIHERAQWILDKVSEAKRNKGILDQKEFDHGHTFLFLGRTYPLSIIEQDLKRCRIDFDTLKGWSVRIPKELSFEDRRFQIKGKMLQWYRQQAKEILGGRIFHYARLIGVGPKTIAVRTQKRLWGCCDYHTQAIHLNWQVILAPVKVIDYVVVHELCHLMVPNHSKRFWKKVEKVMPDFKRRRQWLNTNHLDMVLP